MRCLWTCALCRSKLTIRKVPELIWFYDFWNFTRICRMSFATAVYFVSYFLEFTDSAFLSWAFFEFVQKDWLDTAQSTLAAGREDCTLFISSHVVELNKVIFMSWNLFLFSSRALLRYWQLTSAFQRWLRVRMRRSARGVASKRFYHFCCQTFSWTSQGCAPSFFRAGLLYDGKPLSSYGRRIFQALSSTPWNENYVGSTWTTTIFHFHGHLMYSECSNSVLRRNFRQRLRLWVL